MASLLLVGLVCFIFGWLVGMFTVMKLLDIWAHNDPDRAFETMKTFYESVKQENKEKHNAV